MATQANIISRVFTLVPDKALALQNGDFVRQIKYGGGWSRIRIGMLVALAPETTLTADATTEVDCTLFFGLCSGTTSPVGAYNTNNFVGVSVVGSANINTKILTRTGSATNTPYWSCSVGQIFRKVGKDLVTATAGGTALMPIADTGVPKRAAPIIVDILRPRGSGAGTATITAYGLTTAAQVAVPYRPQDLLYAVDQPSPPIMYGQTLTQLSTTSALTLGDEFGPLDSLNIYWSRNLLSCQIYAVAASVLSETDYGITFTAQGGAESFDLYNTGTAIPSTFTQADGFSASAVLIAGSYANYGSMVGFAGTSCGFPQETFEVYGIGTVISGSTVNRGVAWASYGSLAGSYSNPNRQLGFAGTSLGFPQETFESYGTGTVTGAGGTLTGGTGWAERTYVY